jgi:hypothetical protein
MPRPYVAVLTAALLAGALLRLWQINTVPPGLHYDLAATALLGDMLAFEGYRPIFVRAYTGHEPLYYYWLAAWFRLAGSSVFTLRLAAATLGVLAVATTFFAVRHLAAFLPEGGFRPAGRTTEVVTTAERPRPAGRTTEVVTTRDRGAIRRRPLAPAGYGLAALSAVFLATAFFHIVFSRYGFRVIIEPVVQGLALGFLFWGLSRGSWRRLLLAGAFTGLAAYTYLAARMFPLPLAVFWLALLAAAARRGLFLYYARRLAVWAASALAAFAPLGVYFLRHPEDFVNRAAQVAPRAGESSLLLLGLRRAAEMVFISGEPYDRYNIPGMPLLGPVMGALFVLGLAATLAGAVRNWRLAGGNTQSPLAGVQLPIPFATELLLLAWVPFMLLPTALAVHDVFPSNVRAFGLLPLLFVFPARGLLAAYRGLQRLWPGPLIPYAYPLAVVGVAALALGGWSAWNNYFGTWAGLANQRLANDTDLAEIAGYLNAQPLDETAVYVSAIHYRHPTLAYLARDFDQVMWLTGGSALAVPGGREALYVFARSAQPPDEWIAGWAPYLEAAPLERDGLPLYRAYRFAAGQAPPLPALAPAGENFAHVARLTGYNLLPAEDALLVDLRWQIDNLPEAGDFMPYVRLADAWGETWAQAAGFTYPSEQWRPGDTLLVRLRVPFPPGLPPGDYTARVGLAAGARASLPRLDAAGAYAGERAPLPPVRLLGLPAATAEAAAAAHNTRAPAERQGLNGELRLLGFWVSTLAPRQGERLGLRLLWQAEQAVGAEGLVVSLAGQTLYAGQPARGTLPFASLPPGPPLADLHSLRVPASLAPGPAPLAVSVPGYGQATLAVLDVQAVERAYQPPPVQARVGAALGGLAALHGYSLSASDDGGLSVELAWQALGAIDHDYTVFVHLLDASGALMAQRDAMPRQGAYPTSLWQPGEFVLDTYDFEAAPPGFRLLVGLYDAETGQRLGQAVSVVP